MIENHQRNWSWHAAVKKSEEPWIPLACFCHVLDAWCTSYCAFQVGNRNMFSTHYSFVAVTSFLSHKEFCYLVSYMYFSVWWGDCTTFCSKFTGQGDVHLPASLCRAQHAGPFNSDNQRLTQYPFIFKILREPEASIVIRNIIIWQIY